MVATDTAQLGVALGAALRSAGSGGIGTGRAVAPLLWQPVITAAVIAKARIAVKTLLIFILVSSFQFTRLVLFVFQGLATVYRGCVKVKKPGNVKSM